MTVTIDPPRYVSPQAVLLSWSSDQADPLYRLYVNGVKRLEGVATEYLLALTPGESPSIEVRDDATTPSKAWPQRLTLSWRAVDDTAKYRIKEYAAGTWVTRDTVTASTARHYAWKTPVLNDDTAYQYRVVPVGTNGNDGAPLAFSLTMVRHPDPPKATWAYDDATQILTVTPA